MCDICRKHGGSDNFYSISEYEVPGVEECCLKCWQDIRVVEEKCFKLAHSVSKNAAARWIRRLTIKDPEWHGGSLIK